MISTFHGLEVAKRGMSAQQNALYVTGNNISNANTPGYTRQRVNFEQTEAFPPPSMNRPQIPGQMGTGVKAGSIERIREGFLDVQYRNESTKLGYWETRADALQKMEEVMNEPSESGLSVVMDQFWQSLQDLSINPNNSGARSVVRQRGIAVAETFNYLSDTLKGVQSDLKSEIDISVKEINSLLNQINNINQKIADVEPHGLLPNDLYDQRDLLVDQLSSLVNISVKTTPTGGMSAAKPDGTPMALGKYTIELVTANGSRPLLSGDSNTVNEFKVNFDDTIKMVESITIGPRILDANGNPTDEVNGTPIDIGSFNAGGKLRSLVDSYGYETAGNVKGLYPDMLHKLDQMAFQFAKEFNSQHESGWDLASIKAEVKSPKTFFDGVSTAEGAASKIKLHQHIKDSLDHIASAGKDNMSVGDGANALLLAVVKNKPLTIDGQSSTIQSYYEGAIGDMAVQSQEAARMTNNSGILQQSVEERRQSVSSVSLDEEMTNMIKFQHAYNAAARNITIVDEMLDKIINGMGTGGR
ncbi:flagellar hook-associated protein 1 FlgK [Peribacillus deserti]|uniref:Flagellar hook-associated protein 1 n=1 Tax=Peribacillus deserti TaxID=673318 RepID=A0ABS2QCX8_9BACI|nr:flagellar hook-associated protein FlgK [Peribacillus deserti]MBM7690885.1 flagellar hook-associated protein 1 FlgK [Peribacillus deserti]